MTSFKATKNNSDRLKWLVYILLGLGVLTYIIKYSDWHIISKILFSIPLIINLLFDVFYFKKAGYVIDKIHFDESGVEIEDTKKGKKRIPYSNLKYTIRKRKFDKYKTEIELKTKKSLRFKTFGRLHIKNWETIFDIEKELEKREVSRVEWKPMTLWGKYWGFFIDLFFITAGGEYAGMNEYQQKSIKEATQNPIKEENDSE
ncbi:hypothetical protein F7018_16980 [Tenacibaculum aiptasiae]|uniref:Uncharacterized protein n=1 Tax=Tenacibaculum aiptasiae TaxID=426481 RepID=A0A7J5A719_9FLAO|nr:hypothetical protein [Tenacibaculum aiptasiae]KAB1153361.1 hypothetical protein F7018_16980 [Tenacibaculum aiptasiae]